MVSPRPHDCREVATRGLRRPAALGTGRVRTPLGLLTHSGAGGEQSFGHYLATLGEQRACAYRHSAACKVESFQTHIRGSRCLVQSGLFLFLFCIFSSDHYYFVLKKTEKHHTFPFDRRFLPLRASVLPWWLLCAGSGRWRWVCSVASLAFLGHSRTALNVGLNQIKCKEPDMPKGMICEDIGFKFHRIPMCMLHGTF